MKRWTSTIVTVEGHADSRGSSEYNLALGNRRATVVKEYLVSLGVPAGADHRRQQGQRAAVLHRGERGLLAAESARALHRDRQVGRVGRVGRVGLVGQALVETIYPQAYCSPPHQAYPPHQAHPPDQPVSVSTPAPTRDTSPPSSRRRAARESPVRNRASSSGSVEMSTISTVIGIPARRDA